VPPAAADSADAAPRPDTGVAALPAPVEGVPWLPAAARAATGLSYLGGWLSAAGGSLGLRRLAAVLALALPIAGLAVATLIVLGLPLGAAFARSAPLATAMGLLVGLMTALVHRWFATDAVRAAILDARWTPLHRLGLALAATGAAIGTGLPLLFAEEARFAAGGRRLPGRRDPACRGQQRASGPGRRRPAAAPGAQRRDPAPRGGRGRPVPGRRPCGGGAMTGRDRELAPSRPLAVLAGPPVAVAAVLLAVLYAAKTDLRFGGFHLLGLIAVAPPLVGLAYAHALATVMAGSRSAGAGAIVVLLCLALPMAVAAGRGLHRILPEAGGPTVWWRTTVRELLPAGLTGALSGAAVAVAHRLLERPPLMCPASRAVGVHVPGFAVLSTLAATVAGRLDQGARGMGYDDVPAWFALSLAVVILHGLAVAVLAARGPPLPPGLAAGTTAI